MNLDTQRAICISRRDPSVQSVVDALVGGDYARALSLGAEIDDRDNLVALELRCLALWSSARLREAAATAERLVEITDPSAGPEAMAASRRTLAERLWNIDLRQNYERVRDLLALDEDPVDVGEVEFFRRRVLLADYAQCRGEYDLAGTCLEDARVALDLIPDDQVRTAGWIDYELAACRSFQGRNLLDEALACVERGVALARSFNEPAAEIRFKVREARTFYMSGDRVAGRAAIGEAFAIESRCTRSGVTSWPEIRLEVLFAQGELALYDRDADVAEKRLRAVVAASTQIDAQEAYVEAMVCLTAALLMQEDSARAIAQYRAAREKCVDVCYSDLLGDLDRMSETRRYKDALEASSESTTRVLR